MVLPWLLGHVSPLHLARCQVWVMSTSVLTRHCLTFRGAAGHSLSTGRAYGCFGLGTFLSLCLCALLTILASLLCPQSTLLHVLSHVPYFTQSSAPGRPQLSYFPSPQVPFPPASQCNHAGHGSAALGPAQPLQHRERPDISYGTMPRSISSRRIRYQQGMKSFLKLS